MISRWRHYLPAVFCFLIALVFLAIPFLATLIAVLVLVGFGVFYSITVFHLHRLSDTARWGEGEGPQGDVEIMNDPNFRNVTVYITRNRSWFKDV